MFLVPLFVLFSKEDIKTMANVIVPAIVVSDFSLRFFLKKNTSAAIIPYLTLPIPAKYLIFYIIFSDLLSFWIWGVGLIYGILLYYCGNSTCMTVILLLFCILMNNYLTAFIKAIIGGYAILIYPVCLGLVFVILLISIFFNPVIVVSIILSILTSLITAMFFTLKENIHNELNCIAL